MAAKGRLPGSRWRPQWPTSTAKLLSLLQASRLTAVLSKNCQGWGCSAGCYQPSTRVLKRKHNEVHSTGQGEEQIWRGVTSV